MLELHGTSRRQNGLRRRKVPAVLRIETEAFQRPRPGVAGLYVRVDNRVYEVEATVWQVRLLKEYFEDVEAYLLRREIRPRMRAGE
jgi:hypothetical protein